AVIKLNAAKLNPLLAKNALPSISLLLNLFSSGKSILSTSLTNLPFLLMLMPLFSAINCLSIS
ncbi:hypothetical protein cpu_25280, partial [Carboxydothermus pertinax]